MDKACCSEFTFSTMKLTPRLRKKPILIHSLENIFWVRSRAAFPLQNIVSANRAFWHDQILKSGVSCTSADKVASGGVNGVSVGLTLVRLTSRFVDFMQSKGLILLRSSGKTANFFRNIREARCLILYCAMRDSSVKTSFCHRKSLHYY